MCYKHNSFLLVEREVLFKHELSKMYNTFYNFHKSPPTRYKFALTIIHLHIGLCPMQPKHVLPVLLSLPIHFQATITGIHHILGLYICDKWWKSNKMHIHGNYVQSQCHNTLCAESMS